MTRRSTADTQSAPQRRSVNYPLWRGITRYRWANHPLYGGGELRSVWRWANHALWRGRGRFIRNEGVFSRSRPLHKLESRNLEGGRGCGIICGTKVYEPWLTFKVTGGKWVSQNSVSQCHSAVSLCTTALCQCVRALCQCVTALCQCVFYSPAGR